VRAGRAFRRAPTGRARDNVTGIQRARFALELAAVDYGRAVRDRLAHVPVSVDEATARLLLASIELHRATCAQPDWNVDGGAVIDVTPAGWVYPLEDVAKKASRT
jgi:hypothetical protein